MARHLPRRWYPVSFCLIACCLVVAACSVSSPTSGAVAAPAISGDPELQVVNILPAPATAQGSSDSRIAANDLLSIQVFQADELNRDVRVDGDGSISLPLIGSVSAAGRTTRELEQTLEARYGSSYLVSPDVSVFQKESFGARITLDGQFRKPGVYQSTPQSTLLELVAQAGGLTDTADERKLYVYRKASTGQFVANYSVADIRAGRTANPRLYGGDVVVAFTSNSRVALRNLKEALGVASSAARLAAF